MIDFKEAAKYINYQIKDRNMILFVGAGVSMNLKIPSWSQLIAWMARELEYDPEVFALLGDHLALAEYYSYHKRKQELRSWMDRTWHDSTINIKTSKVHELIVELDFPLIYTTNYDRWIERAYEAFGKPYTKIADVEDFTQASKETTQIIKLHGDFDSSDEAIVLTESSYFERLSFEAPLDIRLRSDILGKTIVFIGYSLNDINIRYLLYRLNKLWQTTGYRKRPKSYILLSKPNPVQEEILNERGIGPIVLDYDSPAQALEAFLQEIKNVG